MNITMKRKWINNSRTTIPIPKEKRIDNIKILSIAPLFAETIKRINEERPLGELFEI